MTKSSNPSRSSLSGLAPIAGVCLCLFSILKRQDARGNFQELDLAYTPESIAPAAICSEPTTEEPRLFQRQEEVRVELPANPEPKVPNNCVQITELARNGESSLAIASALGIALGEVRLTLKLQEIYGRQTSAESGNKAKVVAGGI